MTSRNNENQKSAVIKVKLSESLDISNLLELALQNLNYSREKLIHYTFLIEEAINKWRGELPGNAELEFRRLNSSRNVTFHFSVAGSKSDPFEFKIDDGEEAVMARVGDRLLSGVGRELRYHYRKVSSSEGVPSGINQIILKLPKKNPDEVLFRKAALWLMIPFALQLMIENIATSVDTIMMGFINSDMMSAISLASGFNFIHMQIIDAMIIVETMLMAQFWGERKRSSVIAVQKATNLIAVIISILFFVMTEVFAEQIMSFYTNVPEMIQQGSIYLRSISVSYLMIPFYRTYYCFMRTTGAVKESVLFTAIGCLVNVILNALLIFGLFGIPQMGPLGAGIATICSSLVQVFLVLIYGHRYTQKFIANSGMENQPNRKELFKTISVNSLVTVAKFLAYVIGVNVIAAAYGHMGADITAANALIATITTLFTSFKDGLGNAVGVLMGGLLGKGKMEEAWSSSKIAYRCAVLVAVVVLSVLGITAYLLQYTPLVLNEESMRYFYIFLIIICINTFFGFINGVSNFGCLYAGGQVMPVLIIDTVIMLCVMSPVSMLLIHGSFLPILPTLLFLKMDEVLSAPVKYFFVRKKKWLKKL